MLKTISCHKFISYGQERPPIYFHDGLNTILGSSDGSNSIGKSTFLMIIDFVLGGEDYLEKKTKTVISQVGHHTIDFTLEFDGKEYYFSRNTATPNRVSICSANFMPTGEMSLDEYRKFLQQKYGLAKYGISFRDAVNPYIRVYHRNSLNEEYPLQASDKEAFKSQISRLLKLYGKYQGIGVEEKKFDIAKDKADNMAKSISFSIVNSSHDKAEFKKNEERIKELEKKCEELSSNNNEGLLDLDSLQAERIAEIKSQLSLLRRQRTRIQSKLESIKQGEEEKYKGKASDYTELQRYFPEVNLAAIEEVEEFHAKLAEILKNERRESIESLEATMEVTNQKIAELEKELSETKQTPTVSQATLKQYAEYHRELDNLRDANKNYERFNQFKEARDQQETIFNDLVTKETTSLGSVINPKMKEINDFIFDGKKTAPIFSVSSYKKYDFSVENDNGAGAQFRGLITFDLTVLSQTDLPFLVHDSNVFKNIENTALTKILELYSRIKGKQVFIAFDKAQEYGEKAVEILEKTKVLALNQGGNELFGTSWNKVK